MALNQSELEQLVHGCETEQLHQIGQIQPFGALLSGKQTTIRAVSDNISDYLDFSAEQLLGKAVTDIFPPQLLNLEGDEGEKRYIPGLYEQEGSTLDGVLSITQGQWLLELEPASTDPGYSRIHATSNSLLVSPQSQDDWQAYIQKAVDLFQEVTGFDRIMLYQFLEDGSGEVLAEAGSGLYGSYLGLRFPASDIPQIARNLYQKNPHRLIPDATAQPVAIIAIGDNPIPDLTYSDLRAVSPVHLQYLKNMEVGASLSFSIISGGKLWGLMACHHRTPRFLDLAVRSRCVEMASAFSMGMSAYESNCRLAYLSSVDHNIENAVDSVLAIEAGERSQDELDAIMLNLVGATGGAMIDETGIHSFGRSPSNDFIEDLDQWLQQELREEFFCAECLSEHIDKAQNQASVAAGVMAVCTSNALKKQQANQRFFWFRGEVPSTVHWAGNPQKAVTASSGQTTLSPRSSFELYIEEQRFRSEPWSPADLMTAKKFRGVLLKRLFKIVGLR